MTIHEVRPPSEAVRQPSSAPVETRYRRRMRRADLLLVLSWVSVAIVLALFLAHSSTIAFASVADTVTSMGVICGLVGTNLILLMLVLAARVPVIDRTFGHDKAMHAHRRLGKPAFYLILAHVVLLVVVIVSSFVAVRRRFPYEVWHGIHLLTYAAVLVAIPHELSVGGLFFDGTLQRAYWVVLYIVVVALVVVYRFLSPITRSARHGLTVRRIVEVAPGVVSIELAGRRLRELQAAGGQFLVWRFWTGATWWHAHPLSLSAVPSDTSLRITVRALGEGSGSLASVPVGTRVSIGVLAVGGCPCPRLHPRLLRPGCRELRPRRLRPRTLGGSRRRGRAPAGTPGRAAPSGKVRLVRARAAIGAVLASGVVLLGGWEIGAQHSATSVSTVGLAPGSTGTSGGTSNSGSSASGTDGTFTGAVEQTPYGDVQVSVTIGGGKITEVQALKLTDFGGRSVQISNYAAPMLRSEVLSAQSAKVNSISGATYTSEGYLTSLQAALDSAHFG
jgi:uncharacterized protein with FMN-binding domain